MQRKIQFESSQRVGHTKHVFARCFAPGKLGSVLHTNVSHHLPISVCLAENDVFYVQILDPFYSFPGKCRTDTLLGQIFAGRNPKIREIFLFREDLIPRIR